MEIPFDKIRELCGSFCELSPDAENKLSLYADTLCEWNEKMNLTAITEPEAIAVKHFADCIMLLKYVDIPKGASVIDIGTGAGFPGVVLKIVRPDIKLTLLDSLAKRITFLDALCEKLGIDAVTVHSRAEDGAVRFRETFDVAVARAVAEMRVLSEYCLPYVKVGGIFAAMKGQAAAEESDNALEAVRLLGGKITSVDVFSLADCGARGIITVKKISQTPTKYPRNPSKIAKQPL